MYGGGGEWFAFHCGQGRGKSANHMDFCCGHCRNSTLVSALAGLITPWFLVGSTIVGIATIFAALWYPSRYADVFSGSFDGMAVRATIGVIRRQEIFVPIKRCERLSFARIRFSGFLNVVLSFCDCRRRRYLPLLPETQAFQLAKDMEKYED